MTSLPPLTLGVCSWSLQVSSVPELTRLMDALGVSATQIACGDPNHASWDEGDAMPEAARASGLTFTGAMLGFPGEDYTSPQTIQATGGFGDPASRPERLDRLAWALDRTVALGLTDLTLHAGFLPEPGSPRSSAVPSDTLARAGRMAEDRRHHPGFRDWPGDLGTAPAHARRPRREQSQGQFRPGQHAFVRHGRPDPGRRHPPGRTSAASTRRTLAAACGCPRAVGRRGPAGCRVEVGYPGIRPGH